MGRRPITEGGDAAAALALAVCLPLSPRARGGLLAARGAIALATHVVPTLWPRAAATSALLVAHGAALAVAWHEDERSRAGDDDEQRDD